MNLKQKNIDVAAERISEIVFYHITDSNSKDKLKTALKIFANMILAATASTPTTTSAMEEALREARKMATKLFPSGENMPYVSQGQKIDVNFYRQQGFIEGFKASLSAPVSEDGWVEIKEDDFSTYPKHNIGVLVFIPEEDSHITSGMWDVSNKWVLLDEYRTVGEGEGMQDCKVTHWQPLPKPPQT